MRLAVCSLVSLCMITAGSLRAQTVSTEYLIEALHQYWYILGLIEGAPDATWSAEDDALINSFRAVNASWEGSTSIVFYPPNPPARFADPVAAAEVRAMQRIVEQQLRPGRNRGGVVLSEGGYTLRVHPILEHGNTDETYLPLDWCNVHGSTTISIELPRDGEALIDIENTGFNPLLSFLENSVFPYLETTCPQSFSERSINSDFDRVLSMNLWFYVTDLEFHWDTVPSTCPGEGGEVGIPAYVIPTSEGLKLGITGGFDVLADAGEGRITFAALIEHNATAIRAPGCTDYQGYWVFPFEQVTR